MTPRPPALGPPQWLTSRGWPSIVVALRPSTKGRAGPLDGGDGMRDAERDHEAGASSWLFREMTTLRPHRSARVSSWDRSGRNRDFIMLPAGSTTVLAELDGPGSVQY